MPEQEYRSLSLEDLQDMIGNWMKQKRPREYEIMGGGYAIALLNNDQPAIAEYQRKFRVEKIGKLRNYLKVFGRKLADVLVWLDDNHIRRAGGGYVWDIRVIGPTLKYRGMGWEEDQYVSLNVRMEGYGMFVIDVLLVGDGPVEDRRITLSECTYRSVSNQVNYFVKKMQAGLI